MSTALILSLFSFFLFQNTPSYFFPTPVVILSTWKCVILWLSKILNRAVVRPELVVTSRKKPFFQLYHLIRFKIQNNNRTRYHSPANTIQSKAVKYRNIWFWGTYVIRMSNARWWVKTHCKTLSWISNAYNLQITNVELIFKKGSVGIDECFH